MQFEKAAGHSWAPYAQGAIYFTHARRCARQGDIMEDMNGRPVQTGQEGEGRVPTSTYTLPGVLHFIQHEWTRFERDRSRWEVERAELQVSLAICSYIVYDKLLATTGRMY